MTKAQFKKRWESDDKGGGITYDDIDQCAKEWGLLKRIKNPDYNELAYLVLRAAKTNDARKWLLQNESLSRSHRFNKANDPAAGGAKIQRH